MPRLIIFLHQKTVEKLEKAKVRLLGLAEGRALQGTFC